MAGKKPTMKDVAKLAGVTQPTVSFVLNGTATISEEVRERVLKAIEELHYKPNYNAVALKTRRTHVVGVMLPDLTNAFYSRIASCLERELIEAGYLAMISSTGYDQKIELDVVNRFLDHNVDAIITAYEIGNPDCWKLLRDSGEKVVTIEAGKRGAGFSGVDMDNYFGAYTAAKHLLSEGRRKIVFIGQNTTIEALAIREQGYIDALAENAMEPVIYRTEDTAEKWTGGIGIGERLAKEHEADGILVSSDEIAVGIIKALLSNGARVPEDVSVIGYDNIPLSRLYIPELSTVAQPVDEICSCAAGILSGLLEGRTTDPVVLKPELILRNTTLCT